MKKKKQQQTQFFLILIGFFLLLATYFYYPQLEKKRVSKLQNETEILDRSSDEDEGTNFENVEYKGVYNFDSSYVVKSEKAYIDNKEPDLVYMINMKATLYLKDGREVVIISDKGKFNKITNDCFFSNNVNATDGEIKIIAENLDLMATENSVKIYNNVKLNSDLGNIQADKVNYDFNTKYFNVSMFDDKAVKIKLTQ